MNREVIEVDNGGEVDVVDERRTTEVVVEVDGAPSEVIVSDERSDSTVVVQEKVVEVIEAVAQGPQGPQGQTGVQGDTGDVGPQGPQGPPGSGEDSYMAYEQAVPAAIWTITHPLAKRPSVEVVNSAGDEVIGGVNYVDDATVVLTFAAPFAGFAYLN